nr:hypothetical protein [Mucilaginibacter sp. SP1R1]
MLGDCHTESVETGRGKAVQDNAVVAIAILKKKFNIFPVRLSFIVTTQDRIRYVPKKM